MTDKQGATGTKMSVKSINLFSVVNVQMETSGFGFDDSELTFTYITTPELKGHHIEYASHKLEFPKNTMYSHYIRSSRNWPTRTV